VQRVLGIAPGCCCRDWPDRYEIVVGHFAKVVRMERHEGLSPPRSRNELNTDGIRRVHLDDGAKIPRLQTVGRDVVCEDDNVEGMQRHEMSPGYAVTKCGAALSGRRNQTLITPADCPFGPMRIARIVHAWPSGSSGILSDLLPFAPSQFNGVAGVRRDADAIPQDVACNAVRQAISLALYLQETQVSQRLFDRVDSQMGCAHTRCQHL